MPELVASGLLVMVVDGAGCAARDCADCSTGSAACYCTDGRAPRGSNAYALNGFANVVMSTVNGVVIAMGL